MKPVENPMVLPEKEKKVIGTCEGCQEEIYEGEPVYDFQGSDAQGAIFHQNKECCFQYVSEMSVCKVAGE
jgi:hypothetical protein